jgi:glucose-6-phosphate 1-epimerase
MESPPFILFDTPRCRARLTPHGAQVCEWTPAGQASPVLFLSPLAQFADGKAIRGGVPICFPWFGPHPTDPRKPAHGFARTSAWQVDDKAQDADGIARVVFRLVSNDATRLLWNADFVARLTVVLDTSLQIALEVENSGTGAFVYEAALHNYLTVGDVTKVCVHGLEKTHFLDRTDGLREKISGDAPLAFDGEVDRTFVNTTAACTVDDPVLKRQIRVHKIGSATSVAWNPGPAKGLALADLGEGWRHFVCVETANCGPNAVHLEPGARHTMTTVISAG